MPRRTEPTPSQTRTLHPTADPDTLAWVAEKARDAVDHSPGNPVGWEWLAPDPEAEPDPENGGPVARVFDGAGRTVVAVTEGD